MSTHRRSAAALALLVAALTGAAVAPAPATNVNIATPDMASLSGELKGSGSTLAARYYRAVIASFGRSAKGVTVEYRGIGSGRGKTEFGKNATDFAGTDSLVKDTDGPKAGDFFYVPTTAIAIAVAFNVKGVDDLKLSAPTISKIFQRDIKRWNDPSIVAENPNVRLPNRLIGVVHRSDRSGTTSNFTKFLDGAAPGVWRLGSGDTVRWPANSSQGEGNRGVAQILANNDGSIGYTELADAKAFGLRTVAIRNKAGVYVRPTPAGVTAALSQVSFTDDLTFQPLDAEGASSYPLTSATYVLVRTTYPDQRTADLVKAFVAYILNEGQDLAVQVNYARLPEPLRIRALAQLDQIMARSPS